MFGLVHALRVDAEEGVRHDGRHGRVAEEAVDEEDGVQAERDGPAEGAEAGVRVAGPDDAVVVSVEVVDVLDDDLQFKVLTFVVLISSTLTQRSHSAGIGLSIELTV